MFAAFSAGKAEPRRSVRQRKATSGADVNELKSDQFALAKPTDGRGKPKAMAEDARMTRCQVSAT
ncbi:MAG: hypothetical protein J7494_09485 [Sphingobium sp.]|nr:hypothetical protein [Sphingobium sp.]